MTLGLREIPEGGKKDRQVNSKNGQGRGISEKTTIANSEEKRKKEGS